MQHTHLQTLFDETVAEEARFVRELHITTLERFHGLRQESYRRACEIRDKDSRPEDGFWAEQAEIAKAKLWAVTVELEWRNQ